tara:strand:- start:43 stop:384 length:342 start_codon:yes stop_codon:yes gene_type:complete
MEIPMRIRKGTFKIKEHDGSEPRWTFHDGSYGMDFPFYVHRKEERQHWTLSHQATGYAIKQNITLKQARTLSKALKDWPLFLMPTAETIQHQKSLLPTYKQNLLQQIVNNCGE